MSLKWVVLWGALACSCFAENSVVIQAGVPESAGDEERVRLGIRYEKGEPIFRWNYPKHLEDEFLGCATDEERAVLGSVELLRQAREGDQSSEYELGYLQFYGMGMPVDLAEAERCFRLGWKINRPIGSMRLARALIDGQRVERDPGKAADLVLGGLEHGFKEMIWTANLVARYYAEKMEPSDPQQAMEILTAILELDPNDGYALVLAMSVSEDPAFEERAWEAANRELELLKARTGEEKGSYPTCAYELARALVYGDPNEVEVEQALELIFPLLEAGYVQANPLANRAARYYARDLNPPDEQKAMRILDAVLELSPEDMRTLILAAGVSGDPAFKERAWKGVQLELEREGANAIAGKKVYPRYAYAMAYQLIEDGNLQDIQRAEELVFSMLEMDYTRAMPLAQGIAEFYAEKAAAPDPQEALRVLNRALEVDPNAADVLVDCIQLSQKAGLHALAWDYAMRDLALARENARSNKKAYAPQGANWLAWMLIRGEDEGFDAEKIKALVLPLLEFGGGDALRSVTSVAHHLAWREEPPDPEKAMQILEAVVAADPEYARGWRIGAVICEEQGNYDRAWEWASRVLEIEDDEADGERLRAQIVRVQVAQATGRIDDLERADLLAPFVLLTELIPDVFLAGGGIVILLGSLIGLIAMVFVTRRSGTSGPGIFVVLFWIVFPAIGAGVWIQFPMIGMIAEACLLLALILSLAPGLRVAYFPLRSMPSGRTLVSAIGVVLGCFILIVFANFGYEKLYVWLTGESLGVQWVALHMKCDNAYEAAAMFFMAALCAPVIEEITFRGFLLDWFRRRMAWIWAILCVSLIFALIHGWTAALPIFFVGLTSGWLRFHFKNLWPSVLLHMLNNGIALIGLWLIP
ncbi:CPBP family glutamic-type intramembrane protease [Pontiellaceae bacterium B12219]|nr:CPBP family glutamic-type intramembrane protease [Pontiellaceae bacterium B12219]